MSESEGKEELLMGSNHKESLSEGEKNTERSCSACKTTKTPLWRGGPSGPKSLCNACGIRFRKKRASEIRVIKGGGSEKRKEMTCNTATAPIVGSDSRDEGGLSESMKLGLAAWSKEVLLKHRSSSSSSSSSWFSSPVKRQRSKRKLREEEEAAVLLMSLSCGSVFA